MSMFEISLSINLAALIALLLHLLGLRQAPDPWALVGGGHTHHPQALVALQRLSNARREFNYWQGVRKDS